MVTSRLPACLPLSAVALLVFYSLASAQTDTEVTVDRSDGPETLEVTSGTAGDGTFVEFSAMVREVTVRVRRVQGGPLTAEEAAEVQDMAAVCTDTDLAPVPYAVDAVQEDEDYVMRFRCTRPID